MADSGTSRLEPVRITFEVERETDTFREADELTYSLMNRLIGKYDELQHLRGEPIKLLLRLKPQVTNGRVVLGKASKATAKERLLHPWKFTIWLFELFWRHNPDRREALLFHELCHCQFNEKGEPKIVSHDIEEFYAVARYYGDWNDAIRPLRYAWTLHAEEQAEAEAAQQLITIPPSQES